mmetsp:Transcript_9111/g.21828  ORF Transcript_9111/g.21828 Transcript_9111/m.21828 type:complete len:314 (-) Transcript_9111:127-1068(-)
MRQDTGRLSYLPPRPRDSSACNMTFRSFLLRALVITAAKSPWPLVSIHGPSFHVAFPPRTRLNRSAARLATTTGNPTIMDRFFTTSLQWLAASSMLELNLVLRSDISLPMLLKVVFFCPVRPTPPSSNCWTWESTIRFWALVKLPPPARNSLKARYSPSDWLSRWLNWVITGFASSMALRRAGVFATLSRCFAITHARPTGSVRRSKGTTSLLHSGAALASRTFSSTSARFTTKSTAGTMCSGFTSAHWGRRASELPRRADTGQGYASSIKGFPIKLVGAGVPSIVHGGQDVSLPRSNLPTATADSANKTFML